MTLQTLLQSDSKLQDIGDHLDALDPVSRRGQALSLDGKSQQLLYERASEAPPLGLDFFVPAEAADDREVIHYGRNSQPAFRYFQKRWCRPTNRPQELWGYNETHVRPLIGPGYFVAHATENEGGDPRGAVVVDYFMTPKGPMPAGWPPIKPNSSGLQRFIYNNCRDYMRRTSKHVSIGIAYRLEKRVMGYFVLCREDGSESG